MLPYFCFQVACKERIATCVLPAPQAIFNATMPFIQEHKFEINGNSSSESVKIPDYALNLTVLQDGCEEVVQEFRLDLDGTVNEVTNAAQTAKLIAEIFINLPEIAGKDADKLAAFVSLGQLLGEYYMKFDNFSEAVQIPVPVNNNNTISFEVAKMNSPKRTLLTLIMRVS